MDTNRTAAQKVARLLAIRSKNNPWSMSQATAFVNSLAESLGTTGELKPEPATFTLDLSSITLSGFDDVWCRLFDDLDEQQVREFINAPSPGVRIAFLLGDEKAGARRVAGLSSLIVLDRGMIGMLLTSSNPVLELKRLARAQLPIRRLIPFNTVGTAAVNMFVGRMQEVARLIQSQEQSYAVIGPSRIGKSSLLRFYRHEIKRLSSAHAGGMAFVDGMEFEPKRPDAVLRRIAMCMESGRQADSIDERSFPKFLSYIKAKYRVPITLVIDEADWLCESSVLDLLAMCMKNGLCRCILAGRSALMHAVHGSHSAASHRLSVMRLGAIDEAAARRLLVRPINDLGLRFEDEIESVHRIMEISGRLPSLIQFLGGLLCEKAVDTGRHSIAPAELEEVIHSFDVRENLLGTFESIEDPLVRLIALRCYLQGDGPIVDSWIRAVAAEEGVDLSNDELKWIAIELVVNHVLLWQAGGYRTAQPALSTYLKEAPGGYEGLLDGARRRLRRRYS